jgi:hypothetical protein
MDETERRKGTAFMVSVTRSVAVWSQRFGKAHCVRVSRAAADALSVARKTEAQPTGSHQGSYDRECTQGQEEMRSKNKSRRTVDVSKIVLLYSARKSEVSKSFEGGTL